jgi:hypothetical protein
LLGTPVAVKRLSQISSIAWRALRCSNSNSSARDWSCLPATCNSIMAV